jgi:hypothetical protein
LKDKIRIQINGNITAITKKATKIYRKIRSRCSRLLLEIRSA